MVASPARVADALDGRLHALQHLRAVAALLVVYHHSVIQHEPWYRVLPEFGEFGVDVFFVVSGFVMVHVARPDDAPARFLARRALRVVPLYWFFTLLMAAMLWLAPQVARTVEPDAVALLKSLAFVPYSPDGDPERVLPLLTPGWTLNYEMYFYAVFAAALTLPGRLRTGAIAATLALPCVAAALVPSPGVPLAFYGDPIVFEFVAGMLIAHRRRRGPILAPVAARAALLVGAAALFALPADWPRALGYGLPATLIVAGALDARLPGGRGATLLGDASYALYLSHLFTLGVLRVLLPPVLGDGVVGAVAFVAIALPACALVSIGVHLVLEPLLAGRVRETRARLLEAGRALLAAGRPRVRAAERRR